MFSSIIRRSLVFALAFVLIFSSITVAQAAWLFGFGGSEEPAPSDDGPIVSEQLPWGGAVSPSDTPPAASDPLLDDIIDTDHPKDQAIPASADLPEAAVPQTLETDESSIMRVKLSSLNQPVALGLSFSGQYSVDGDKGFRLAKGAEVSVAVDGGNLLLTAGGLTIDMGTRIDFVRHQEGAGVSIHENKYDTLYRGNLRLINEGGVITPIVLIDVDEYLYGVVPFEMSDSFPIEALKAQAVAARTYSLSRRAANASRDYDVVDTTADQVFRGFNADYENAIAAVDATRYVAGRYKDGYATTYFGASNGGETALPGQIWSYSGDYGYLDQREDPYDVANKSSVVKRLSLPADVSKIKGGLASRIKGGVQSAHSGEISSMYIRAIEPTAPKVEGTHMYRTLNFQVELAPPAPATVDGSTAEPVVPETQMVTVAVDFYGDLKPNFGLKINSADCEVVQIVEHRSEADQHPASFDIESRRFGHGVGMSQRGAQYMASEKGFTWTQILAFYYPGLQFSKMAFDVPEIIQIEALPASVGYARAKPTPKPTPAPLPALSSGEYYAKTKLASKSSTLNVREQPSTDAKIVNVLASSQRVIVIREMPDGWAEIKTAEFRGYCSMEYLERE